VIKKGYAVIIQNTDYKEYSPGSVISGVVMSEFFRSAGFETQLPTKTKAQVLCYFYLQHTHKGCS